MFALPDNICESGANIHLYSIQKNMKVYMYCMIQLDNSFGESFVQRLVPRWAEHVLFYRYTTVAETDVRAYGCGR
jgi:hypothetical protein